MRTEADIISEIASVYIALSPENLACDGEASQRDIDKQRNTLSRRLFDLKAELGRDISEEEAFDFKPPMMPESAWRSSPAGAAAADRAFGPVEIRSTADAALERVRAITHTDLKIVLRKYAGLHLLPLDDISDGKKMEIVVGYIHDVIKGVAS